MLAYENEAKKCLLIKQIGYMDMRATNVYPLDLNRQDVGLRPISQRRDLQQSRGQEKGRQHQPVGVLEKTVAAVTAGEVSLPRCRKSSLRL